MKNNTEQKEKKNINWKNIAGIAMLLAVISILAYWSIPKTSTIVDSRVFDETKLETAVKLAVEQISADDYEALSSNMTDEMLKALSPEVLTSAKAGISENFGAFESLGNIQMVEISQRNKRFATAQVVAGYENVAVTYTISFDSDMKLSGLYMK